LHGIGGFKMKNLILYSFSFILTAFFSNLVFAQNGVSKSMNVQGTIYQPSSSNPFLGVANIRFQILNQAATCVLYQETVTAVNTTNTNGAFSVDLGTTATRINNIDATTTLGINIFKNNITHASVTGCAGAVVIGANEKRKLRIAFDVGSGFSDMSPDVEILTAPYAMIAETLDGHAANEFIMANTSAGMQVSQANLETLLNSITNFNTLNNFAQTGNISGNAATATTASTVSNGAITANKLAQMGATTGQVMKWDGASWVASNDLSGAGGTVTSVTASLPLSASVGTTPNITIATANTTTTGALTSTDWNTFNNKLSNFSTMTSNDISTALSYAPVSPITLNNSLNNYLPLAGGTLTGAVNVNSQNITNLGHMTMMPNKTLHLGNLTNAQQATLVATPLTSADKGKVWFNTDDALLKFWDGSAVQNIASGGGSQWTTSGSNISYSTGNVGIGTSSPAEKLDINGNIKVNDSLVFSGIGQVVKSDNTGFNALTGGTSASNTFGSMLVTYGNSHPTLSGYLDLYAGLNSGGPIRFFKSNGLEAMRIASSGTVGIGTSTPFTNSTLHLETIFNSGGVKALEIRGPASDNNWGGGIHLTSNNTTTTDASIITSNGGFDIINSKAAPIRLSTNSVERVRVDATGKVGIGITSPTAKLQIASSDGTASSAPLKFTSGTNLTTPEAGAVEYDGTNLYFTDSGAIRRTIATASGVSGSYVAKSGDTMTGVLNITASSASADLSVTQSGAGPAATFMGGHVGIGTETPSSLLHIRNGTIRSDVTTSVGTYNLNFDNNIGLRADGTGFSLDGFYSGSWHGPYMFVSRVGGNVGIGGITSPSYKLDVAGDVNVTGNFKINGANINTGTVTNVTGTSPISVATGTSTPVISIATANTTTTGALSSSDFTTFNNKLSASTNHAGDVSGTYSALTVDKIKGQSLTLGSNTSGNYLRNNGTGWVNANLQSGDITTSLGYTPANNSNLSNYLTTSVFNGYVASANCTTSQTMYWNSVSSTFSCANISISTSQITGLATSASVDTTNASNISSGTLNAARLPAGVATQWTTTGSNIYYNSGNVGIGTTSPTSKLDVVGASMSAFGVTALRISSSSSGYGASIQLDESSGAGGRKYNMISTSSNNSTIGGGKFAIYDVTGDAYRFTMDSSGNVGIGTTTPAAKLEVQGQVVSKTFDNGSNTSFDLNNGNIQFTAANCGIMNLSNMVDGGSYQIVVQGGLSAVCDFNHSGLTFRYNPANDVTTGNTHTIYSMTRVGNNVYVNWITGY
jgi:trimeric autotransporter adhesin